VRQPETSIALGSRQRRIAVAQAGEQPDPGREAAGIWRISVKEVSTLLRRVALEGLANGLPEGFAGALCRLAQRRLELGESLLDWVEVGAVGRQVDELCALRLDRRGVSGISCAVGRFD
jgi:hypothetical protein